MPDAMAFAHILDEVEKLPVEDQDVLKDIIAKRVVDLRRDQIAREIREARTEYEAGGCQPVSVNDLMKEITS